MLCPRCKRTGKDVKMKCVTSVPGGSFIQYRRYVCPECEDELHTDENAMVEGWNIEVLGEK